MSRQLDDRGQLVLLAAGVIAIALLPIVFAYFQLGYTGDVRAGEEVAAPDTETLRALERAAFDAGSEVQGTYPAGQSDAARSAFLDRFEQRVDAIETARLESGVVVEVDRNRTAASTWSTRNCPGGPGQEFGACTVDTATVLQDRAGDVHVLAVGVDVRIATADGHVEGTYVLNVELGEREAVRNGS